MTIAANFPFPARVGGDRNAFLVFIGLVWIGILTGFGSDSLEHIQTYGLDYPLIVHVHAVSFVAWLVLFTVQILLIRNGRPDLHKRLGIGMMVLALWLLIIGPATGIAVDITRYKTSGRTPEFLAVQLGGMIAFAGYTGAAAMFAMQSLEISLLFSESWKALSLHIIGF